MFSEWENNSGKLQIISGKLQNSRKFENNAINNVKQISVSHVIKNSTTQRCIYNPVRHLRWRVLQKWWRLKRGWATASNQVKFKWTAVTVGRGFLTHYFTILWRPTPSPLPPLYIAYSSFFKFHSSPCCLAFLVKCVTTPYLMCYFD